MVEPVGRLSIARIVRDTDAEGPGRRFAVWLQGCPLRCPGCCNPEMLPFSGGEPKGAGSLAREAIESPSIEGVTLLGGEPFAQASGAAEFARRVRGAGLSVMVFSGYSLDELRAMRDSDVERLLDATDILVDGRYRSDLPETRRRWVGSANQVVHFLTDRYRPTDPRFVEPNTLELRLTARDLLVNGWPAAAAEVLR